MGKNADKSASQPNEDLKIYVNDPNERSTAPWIICDYQEKGALTDTTKAQIIEQFKLNPALVEELSLLVGNSLDTETVVSFTRVSRKKAVKRGRESLDEAARLAKRLRTDHATIRTNISQLQTTFDAHAHAAPLLASLRDDLAAIQSVVGSLEKRIDELIKIENGVAKIEPDDKRKARDARREHVVRSCCYIWEDAGRPLSYTSKSSGPVHQRRGGPLVDLVQIVTRAVTDPPSELPPETIRRDIDKFKELRAKGRI